MSTPSISARQFRHLGIEVATWIFAVLVCGCGGGTETGTTKHVDVFDSGAGGGVTGTGGTRGSGGATRPSDGGNGAGPSTLDAAAGGQSTTSDAASDGTPSRVDAEASTMRPDAQVVDCANSPTCPSAWCDIQCCPGPGECAPCCVPKACQGFDAAHCPLERCQLLPGCGGTRVCYPPFSGPAPTCGVASYYGAAVPCCSGLVKRCGAVASDGTCDPTVGGYQNIPWCIACGDGTCDAQFENRCSCPEDCH
jgi:hypothetical protein